MENVENDKLEKKPKQKKEKIFPLWIFFLIALIVTTFIATSASIVILLSHFFHYRWKSLTPSSPTPCFPLFHWEYQTTVLNNLRSLLIKKDFIVFFDTIYDLSDWLSESGETDFGKAIKELQPIRNLIKNKTSSKTQDTTEIKKKLEEDLCLTANISKNTEAKDKETEFINCFKNLFIFGFLREIYWEEEKDNLFSYKNLKILEDYSIDAFKLLSDKSQELVWKKCSINILFLLTNPSSWSWLFKTHLPLFCSSEEEKNFSELIEKLYCFFFTEKERKEQQEELIEEDSSLEEKIQDFNNIVSKSIRCKFYRNIFNETIIIEYSSDEPVWEDKFNKTTVIGEYYSGRTLKNIRVDFRFVLRNLFLFYWLKNETVNDEKLNSLLKNEDKINLVYCFKILFLLELEEDRNSAWKKIFPGTDPYDFSKKQQKYL